MSRPLDAPPAPDAAAPLDDWLHWLEGRDPSRIELGLERVQAVLRRLELQPRNCPLITVAGTNGKGSVVANLDALATAAGLRAGAYLSPHLLRFNERIRLSGEDVDDDKLVAAFLRVAEAEQGDVLTYFEFTTLAAIVLLHAAELDLWVLEVGLGGRLDAVNVLDADLVVLTSIGLDHTDWLGDSLAGIAREKLGVLRPGIPLICGVGPNADASVLAAIHGAVRSLDTPLFQLGEHIRYAASAEREHWAVHLAGKDVTGIPPLRLAGAVQLGNAALAIAALEQLGVAMTSEVLTGLGAVRLPGRCQTLARSPRLVVDTAHNTEAATALAQALGMHDGRTHGVLGMLRGKPVAQVVAALAGVVDEWHYCGLPRPRGLSAEALAGLAGEAGQQHDTVADGLVAARAAAGVGGRVLATGSFLTVEAVLKSQPMTPETVT